VKIRDQRLTVILVPQGGARTYSFQARVDLLVAVGTVLVLMVLVTATLMFTYGRYFQASRQTAKLQDRVKRLEHDLAQVEDLRRELAENETTRKKVLGLIAAGVAGDSAAGHPAAIAAVGGDQPTSPEEIRARAADFSRSVPRTWPLRGPVTKSFLDSAVDERGFHPGIDIAGATGTPVRAAAGGVVTFAGWDKEYGNLVIVDHGMALETRYGHNSRLAVTEGQRVDRGQLIAAVGSTGRSTAPHVHFEIRKDGVAVDPRKYLE
jgi:murein DD-endopeptidase MepM/ murein hydrolase activator NlpD